MQCQNCAQWRLDLNRLAKKLRQGAELMVGQPDYEAYARHRRETHPDEPVMSREEFFFEAQARRFGESRAMRCC